MFEGLPDDEGPRGALPDYFFHWFYNINNYSRKFQLCRYESIFFFFFNMFGGLPDDEGPRGALPDCDFLILY